MYLKFEIIESEIFKYFYLIIYKENENEKPKILFDDYFRYSEEGENNRNEMKEKAEYVGNSIIKAINNLEIMKGMKNEKN